MNAASPTFWNSSIAKKQIVALTGLFQTFFILGHLTGNFLLYKGPEAFNGYAEFLASRGSLLWVFRGGFLLCFLIHIFFAVRLYLENRVARGRGYAVSANLGATSFAKKSMIYSGLLIFFFLWLHLSDFTLGEKEGAPTVVDGEALGLFGLVWNSFLLTAYWWRPLVYIGVVVFLGLHLSHGIQSVFQTFGFNQEKITPWIERLSLLAGWVIALGYSSIPVYVNIMKSPPI